MLVPLEKSLAGLFVSWFDFVFFFAILRGPVFE
jgi:hypothetical protein